MPVELVDQNITKTRPVYLVGQDGLQGAGLDKSVVTWAVANGWRPGGQAPATARDVTDDAARGHPVAKEALERIARLYGIEKEIRGRSPAERREARLARPHFQDLSDSLLPVVEPRGTAIRSRSQRLATGLNAIGAIHRGLNPKTSLARGR